MKLKVLSGLLIVCTFVGGCSKSPPQQATRPAAETYQYEPAHAASAPAGLKHKSAAESFEFKMPGQAPKE